MSMLRKLQDGGSAYDKWLASLPSRLRSDKDYDLKGYYNKYGATPVKGEVHLTDEFKKPNHVTFSDESVYSNNKTPGGKWAQQNGKWSFTPSDYNINNVGLDSLKNYFKTNEPDSKLVLPQPQITMPVSPVMKQDATSTLRDKVKQMAGGGPVMKRSTIPTSQLPVAHNIVDKDDRQSRVKVYKALGQPTDNIPYSQNDFVNSTGKLQTVEENAGHKYFDNIANIKPQFLKVKDSKYNQRNNELVGKQMLDDIVKASVKSKIDPYTALAIGQRESGLGNDKTYTQPQLIYSSWYTGVKHDAFEKAADKKIPKDITLEQTKGSDGNKLNIPAAAYNKMEEFNKNNTQYPFQAEMNTINEKTKNGTFIRGYNYGDPDYGNKVAKEREILMAPENAPFRKYVDSVTNVAKQEMAMPPKTMANGGDMKTKIQPKQAPMSLRSKMRKMGVGGMADPDDVAAVTGAAAKTGSSLSAGAFAAGASIGTGLIDTFSPADKYGVRSNGAAIGTGALKGAAEGAALGSAVPIVGTAIGAGAGAIIGGVEGLIGNKKANKAKILAINNMRDQEQRTAISRSGAIIAADPSLKYGDENASMYAMGGTMKGTLPQMPRMTKPIPKVQPSVRTMPNVAEVPGRQMSRMAKGGVIAPPAYDMRKLSRPFMPHTPHVPTQNLSAMANGGQVLKTSDPSYKYPWLVMGKHGGSTKGKLGIGKLRQAMAAQQQQPQQASQQAPVPIQQPQGISPMEQQIAQGQMPKMAAGGLAPLSAGNAKVEGPSHANGGVKFPQAGVELEGNETVNGDFVFSKKLGFAQQHEKIARAMGRVEKKPDTPETRNTLNALQRQTEMLKAKQEATKQQMGIPSELDPQAPQSGSMAMGGNLRSKMKRMDDGGKTTAKKDTLLWTQHADGHIGPWGNPLPVTAGSPTPPPPLGVAVPIPQQIPPIGVSDKTRGIASNYYTPSSQPTNPTPATIRSNSYKNGGKIKKMDAGGDATGKPYYPLYQPQAPGQMPSLPELNVSAGPATDSIPMPGNIKPASGKGKPSVLDNIDAKISQVGDTAAPFLPNIYEAFRKLPLPPTPVKESEMAPNLVDYSASKAEAIRQTRGANKAAEDNLNTGAAVAATRAANLAGQERTLAGIGEAEQTANAGIRNQNNMVNMQVRARNNSLTNQFNQELTQRQLKGQELTQQNLASIAEKIQGMKKDKAANNLDEQRLMIEAMKDNTGASYRGIRNIFQKNLSKDDMAKVDKHYADLEAMNKQDRESGSLLRQSILTKLRAGKPLSDNELSTWQVLNGKSAIATEDEQKKIKQTSTRRSEQN